MRRNFFFTLTASASLAVMMVSTGFAQSADEQQDESAGQRREERTDNRPGRGYDFEFRRGRMMRFRPPQIPLMSALDANQDGEISADEIENAAAALKSLDKNDDGKLTREEVRPQFDVQGRGEFSRRDHDAARPGEHRANRPERHAERGERERRGPRPDGPADFEFRGPRRVIDLVMKLDVDDDEQLSQEEFLKLFTTVDDNEDGFVSRAEMEEALMERLREHGPPRHGPRFDGRGWHRDRDRDHSHRHDRPE